MAKKGKPEYKIRQKRNGRFEVLEKSGKNINGEKKAEILLKAGKIQPPKKKKEGGSAPAEEKTEA